MCGKKFLAQYRREGRKTADTNKSGSGTDDISDQMHIKGSHFLMESTSKEK
jgi:hypothetical protein